MPDVSKGGLYFRAVDVEDVINWLRNVSPSTKTPPDSYYSRQLENLNTLKETCETVEKEFFSKFGINEGTILERTKIFQQKVDEYSKITGLDYLIGDLSANAVQRLNPWFDEISFEEIAKELGLMFFSGDSSSETNIINDIFKEGEVLEKEILPLIIRFLNKQLLGSDNDRREYLQLSRGLINYITFTIDIENKAIGVVLLDEKTNIPLPIRRKIKKALKIYNKKKEFNRPVSDITKANINNYQSLEDPNLFRDDVINVIQEILIHKTGIIKDQILLSELERAHNPKYYSVAKNSASVKGFMGEIASNAILRSLLNDTDGTIVIPTGSLLKDIKGHQEIPIDTVIQIMGNQFHIQVKNYNLNGGIVTFSYKNQADTLITGRLGMPMDQTLTKVLTQFFGAFHFNQPFQNEVYSEEKLAAGYMSIDEYRNQIYSQFESSVTYDALSKIFSANIDKIIKLDDIFNVNKNNLFGSFQMYTNTFFKINKFYIPASLILNSIIKTIVKYLKNQQSVYNAAHVTSISDTWGYTNTLDEIVREAHRSRTKWRGRGLDKTAMDMAMAVKVNYNVSFNIGEILQEALDEVVI